MNPLVLLIGGASALLGGAFSARWNWWRPTKPGCPILMYHKIGDPPSQSKLKSLWVPVWKFRKQMAYLADEGYHPITFKDIYNHIDKNVPLPSNPVLLTFDDGYANNYTHAYPILRDFGFRATIFVVIQTVGWENGWHDPVTEERVAMITWAQLKELQKSGWEIGSHTLNHSHLSRQESSVVRDEVTKSREIIGEFLDVVPPTFAYPYGDGEDDERIKKIVKETGYRVAVGVHPGKWSIERMIKSPYNLPRVTVRGSDNLLDFHLHLTRGRSRF